MNCEVPAGEVTQLLLRWRAGDETALDSLMPLVYDELRSLARRHLSRERGAHTLQRTALVHEAFLRMVDQTQTDWKSRSQFLAVASQMMRRILVDHARRRSTAKRGGGAQRVDFDAVLATEGDDDGRLQADTAIPSSAGDDELDFEAVHQALERLERLDPDQGKLVELRFFGGLSIQDASGIMGISPATAKREWAIARAWLQRELTAGVRP
ncbi:MAG: sigma-70 family RNA polymerase sigma factor [Steroidobacteraceae bacterium]